LEGVRVSADKSIPARPNLEQYRRQAKDLVKAWAQLQPQALERIRRHHPRLSDLSEDELQAAAFRLSDAQLVLAREHAFKTWPQFVRNILSGQRPPRADRYAAHIDAEGKPLDAQISGWRRASALVLVTDASGVRSRASTRFMANQLNRACLCTVVCDLLSEDEQLEDAESEILRYELRLLARRIGSIMSWIALEPALRGLGIGCFSSGTGAAAALLAATEHPMVIRALVSSGGRPDLAGPWLWRVRAPTLLLVGMRDSTTIQDFNGSALQAMPPDIGHSLELLEGASQAFVENPLREKVVNLALEWFQRHLIAGGVP
jgi:putative phosphoribosyl transferase